MSVTTPRKEYELQLPDVERNRDAVAGERKVKQERTKYLPPTPSMCINTLDAENGFQQIITPHITSEGTASYAKYLSLAYFYGASGRTVDGLSGLIFSKDPEKEIATAVEYLDDNVDGKGTSLRRQSQSASEEGFITPRSGLLVDYPQVGQHVSVAEAERMNLRPKILHYPFESIINWHFEVIDNEQKLSMLVLVEPEEELTNEFEVKQTLRYRVLRLIDGVLYTAMYDSGGNPETELLPVVVDGEQSKIIPFFFIEVGAQGKSVINDLVDANFNHYRFFADYAMKEHTSAFPVFYETGAVDEDRNMAVGPGVKWSNPNTDAQFGVIQSDSDGGSMRTYLLDMEVRMAALGAEMLKPRIASAESAAAKSLDKVAQDSTTANVANTVSEAYEKALSFAARWMGSDEESVYQLNTNYDPAGLSGQDLTALVGAWQSGSISYATFYENLQRGQVANSERSVEEEQGMINNAELGFDGA